MGFLDKFKRKEGGEKQEEKEEQPEGKYSEPCALCGKSGTEKKWMGQYWHRKCVRKSRKFAKGMI